MKRLLIIFSLCLFALPIISYAGKSRAELEQQFIDKMVTKYHFDRDYISNLITGVKVLPKPIKHVKHPAEDKPWYIYENSFVNEDHIKSGLTYWNKHAKALGQAEKEYGVPASIIVAIIGVETHYGRNKGTFPTLNALVTLAFTQSVKTDFFQYELTQFFLLTRELHLDPRKVRGSYAGAIGYPQFMPGAYRQYAVDFDGNGKKDLFNDTDDVVGSIANFMQHLGWHENEPIAVKAKVTGEKYQKILNKRLKPMFTVAELRKYGIEPEQKLADNCKVNLIRLKTKQGYEFWLGLHNFYVITYYNAHVLYAMATYQLAEKLKSTYSSDKEQQFINKMVMEYHFNKNYISQLISNVQFAPEVIQHVQKPYEEQPWYIYRKLFVSDERAKTGNNYWKLHSKTLARAEKIYGVPPAIIVAIIGIESNYGQQQGSYPIFSTLATLAFDYPPRAAFFQSELTQFLLLTEELKFNPLKLYGSYAGAMGYPQFMPSSYRFYAVDFSDNHKKDLFHSPSDVIGSIANYLKKTGWINNDPIAIRTEVKGNKYQKILNDELNAKYTIAELKKYNIKPYIKLNNKRHANLIRLKDINGYEYWVGLNNFYVITNYNANSQYVMAVFQLAEKIKKLHYSKHHVKKRITTSSGRRSRSSRKVIPTNSAKRS